ncbi:MAG: hypothetical protein QGF59_19130, partial [Pirellulaceae bacterium]|nr:hypothetical protein [Pirellulaceae bacterium]
ALVIDPAGNASGVIRVGASSPVTFQSLETFNVDTLGNTDSVTVGVTDNNDNVSVSGSAVTINGQLFSLTGEESIVVNTGDGDDSVTATPGAVPIAVNGGDPTASDTLIFDGQSGALTIDLDLQTITELLLSPVSFTGFEHVTVNAATADVTVLGTGGDDDIEVAPTGANDATVTLAGLNASFDVSNAGALSLGTLGGADLLTVVGNAANNTIAVARGLTTLVTVDALQPIGFSPASTEALVVEGGLGDDTITVTGSGGPGNLSVDGQGPSASDTLRVEGAASSANNFTVDAGSSVDSGSVNLNGDVTQFSGIEAIQLDANSGGALQDQLTVNGTGGNDVVTLTASTATAGGSVTTSFGPGIAFEAFDTAVNSTVTLATGAGDDTIVANHDDGWAITTVAIDAGDPTASDSVQIIGDNGVNETFAYTPSSANAGTMTVTGGTTTTYSLVNVESLHANARDATADVLNVTTTTAVITPGFPPGSGQVDAFTAGGASQLGLTYENFETTAVTGTTAVIDGTSADDTITVSTAGIVTVTNNLGFNNSVNVAAFTTLILNTLGGNDSVSIDPSVLFTGGIRVIGGEPGTGSDSVQVDSGGAVTVTVDLSATPDTVSGIVGGSISLLGVENLAVDGQDGTVNDFDVVGYGSSTDLISITLDGGDINNNDGDLIDISLTTLPNDLTYTPQSATAGQLALTANPGIAITGFNNVAGGLSIDASGSLDSLTFTGSNGADTIDVSGTAIALTVGGDAWLPIDYASVESLNVIGGDAADTFNVTPSALPVFVDGGDPIGGTPGDLLSVIAGGDPVVLSSGPENDEGNVLVGTNQPVSFDKIESLSIIGNGTNAATVNGTNGDDDITVIGNSVPAAGGDGLASNDFTVSVNAGPAVQFIDLGGLTINAMSGDDDIDVETNMLDLTNDVTLNGDLPGTGGGDTVTVRGDTGPDAASWTPGATADSGTFSVSGETINVTGTEAVAYDGEGDNEAITVNGTGGDDVLVHSPGAAVDAGAVAIMTGGAGRLGLTYVNLGSAGNVTVDGQGGMDRLVAEGTGGDDTLHVDTTDISLTSSLGQHIGLIPTDIDSVTLAGLEGDDRFTVEPNVTIPLQIQGGGPGGSDVLLIDESAIGGGLGIFGASFNVQPDFTNPQDDTGEIQETTGGFSAFYAGIESVQLLATLDDDLRVADDLANNTWTLRTGAAIQVESGRVQIDTRSPILFENFANVALQNLGGLDRFEVTPDRLPAATTYLVDGFETGAGTERDTVAFYGTGTGDIVTVTDSDVTIGVSVGYTDFAALEVNALDGDDVVLVDASAAAVSTQVIYDGGAGFDFLRLTGAGGIFTSTTYSPGPSVTEGRLEYSGAT